MDEVLEKLGTALISPDANENGKTNFEGYYKNWGKLSNQEQRRKDILEVQKGNRNNQLDSFRGILELMNSEEDKHIFENYKKSYRPSKYVAGFTETGQFNKNVLMMSEWMIEKPKDFHENWTVTPCPVGVRTLVVASKGSTKCYTKYGYFKLACKTALPGGNVCPTSSSRYSILDCFYVEQLTTMFILDLLAWNNQPMTDGESDFRHFWLQSKLEEIPELSKLSKNNKLIFKLLPKVSCSPDSFEKFMMTVPHFENDVPKLDGLLFYHKQAHYFAGQTPLVGWLFPFMVPEVIGDVKVNPAYMLNKPDNYKGQADFITEFEVTCARKAAQKRPNSKNKLEKMEAETSPDTSHDISQCFPICGSRPLGGSRSLSRGVAGKKKKAKFYTTIKIQF